MSASPPVGITPPSPGLDREEPRQVLDEHDIPPDGGQAPEAREEGRTRPAQESEKG